MRIRDLTAADYEAITAVYNAVYTDEPRTVAEFREGDQGRESRYLKREWVAECEGRVVGRALYDQYSWEYEPRAFQINLEVLPDYQSQGIGSALYDTLLAALADYQPTRLRAETRSTFPGTLHFLEKRGYQEYYRLRRSEHTVADFDPMPYAGLEDRLQAQGIVIKTLDEVQDDPDHLRKIYDLDGETTLDEPDMSFTKPPFSEMTKWLERSIASGRVHPEAYLLAVHDGAIVGQTYLILNTMDKTLHVGTTGIARAYRRLGIATALKLRSFQYAQANGYTTLSTDNEVRNAPIRELNHRLGFAPQYDLIRYEIYPENKETQQ